MSYFSTKSLLFNGTTQYCDAGDVLGFDRLDPCSFSFWFKTTSSASQAVIGKRSNSTSYRGWVIFVGSALDDVAFHWCENNASGNITFGRAGSGLNDGEWHHGVVTKASGSSWIPDFHIYIDGVDSAITTVYNALNSGSILSSNPTWVGAAASDGGIYLCDGSLDEVAVYDKELSAAEALWLYNAGIAGDLKHVAAPSNLVSWWNMGENLAVNIIPDQQSSNNLSVVGSPVVQDDAPGLTQYQSTYLTPPHWPLYTSEPAYEPEYQSTYLEYEDADYTFVQTFGGGGGPTLKYKMRAQDDGVPAPGYVTWVASGNPDFVGAGFPGGTPTPVGNMVPDTAVVADEWED